MPEQPLQPRDEILRNRLRSYKPAPPVRHVFDSGIRMASRRPIIAASLSAPPQPKARPTESFRPTSLVTEFVTPHHLQRSQVLKRSIQSRPAAMTTLMAQDVTKKQVHTVRQPNSVPAKPRQSRSEVLRRQAVPAPKKMAAKQVHKKTKRKLPRSKAQVAMTSMALFIFLLGVGVSYSTWRTNSSVKSQVSALAQQTSKSSDDGTISGDQVPDETPPKGDINKYQVASDMPRFILIPKLSVKSRVLRLGVTASNELKTPASIYDSGWYDGSAKPGEAGAVLIDGHINGATQPGVFFGLKKLVPGDTITIERGDGKKLNYKVVKSQSYPKDQVDMSSALTPVVPGTKGLNIITCDGKPVPGKAFTYDRRLIIYAEQVN
jgi:sortase (surface protein transpeptidase)